MSSLPSRSSALLKKLQPRQSVGHLLTPERLITLPWLSERIEQTLPQSRSRSQADRSTSIEDLRVLVCGGRRYGLLPMNGPLLTLPEILALGEKATRERAYLNAKLSEFHAKRPISLLIEGEATGADKLSRLWAEENNIAVRPFAANWRKGKFAGPVRNRQMLIEGRPHVVISFPGGNGTANMLSLAREAGVEIVQY